MNSPLDTLKQLKEMLDAGTITPQEFDALKQQLIFSQSAPASASLATEASVPAAEIPFAAAEPLPPVPLAAEPLPPVVEPLPTAALAGSPLATTPAATEALDWMAAPAPLLMTTHEQLPASTERRNPLTLVFAVGGALVLLALVLYLALDNKHDSERLTSASRTPADTTAVAPEVGPQANQITLPPATAPETVRVVPAAAPPVSSAATKFSSGATTTTVTTDSTSTVPERGTMQAAADSTKKM